MSSLIHNLAIPIAPRAGLFLEPLGFGNEQRFIGFFRETWRKFPKYFRQLMLDYWHKDCPLRQHVQNNNLGGSGQCNDIIPRIQLVESPPVEGTLQADGSSRGFAIAACYYRGFLLRFWAAAFDCMPEVTATYTIAHELIHVVLRCHPMYGLPPSKDEEQLVDSMASSLGFNAKSAFEAWEHKLRADAHRVCKRGA